MRESGPQGDAGEGALPRSLHVLRTDNAPRVRDGYMSESTPGHEGTAGTPLTADLQDKIASVHARLRDRE
jgi:hypothetical protein